MYLPVSAAITATSLLAASSLRISNLATNELSLPTSSAALVARQDDTKPPDLITSIQFVTSIAFITSVPTPATSPEPDTSSAPPPPLPPPPPPSTTAETQTSSEQSPPGTSTTAPASSTSSIARSTSSPTSTATSTTTATTTPTPTSHPDSDNGPWISRGVISGIVVGSVLGLIFLCLLAYTLFAASRGINVCDCFGGCCGKHDDKDEENGRDRLPSRSEDAYPHPDVLAPGPVGGYRAYRPPRPVSQQPAVPFPLGMPGQVETQERRTGRLQRGYRGV